MIYCCLYIYVDDRLPIILSVVALDERRIARGVMERTNNKVGERGGQRGETQTERSGEITGEIIEKDIYFDKYLVKYCQIGLGMPIIIIVQQLFTQDLSKYDGYCAKMPGFGLPDNEGTDAPMCKLCKNVRCE